MIGSKLSKTTSRRVPVTVTQLPVTRCQICKRTLAHRPGGVSQVLTDHYKQEHAEALERASGLPGAH